MAIKAIDFVIGLVVIFYTVIGGTAAVNVTQKQQMFIIFSGMIIAFGYILNSFPQEIGFVQALHIAGKTGKLQVLDFSFDPNSRYTFWSGITGGLFLALSYFGTDQSQVQRYLSGKSVQESQMGLLMNGFLKVPMQFFILLVGVMVFVFYQFETAPLHFNPKGVETVFTLPKRKPIQLEKEHLATQKQRHSLLTANLDSASLEQIAQLDTKNSNNVKQQKS